ncbi:hypothetical protein NECID01_2163 [Nematocida sp. AWRm77]|nr:hypothetical protein NECID01_2163 [Nematocida sp. AWRm77]
MAKIVIARNVFLFVWAHTVLVNGAGPSHPDAERVYASMPNLAAVSSYYLNSSLASTYGPRHSVYHGSSASAHNELPSMQSDCEPLDLSCKTGARESSSCSSATILTTSNTPTHACSSSAAKRIHEEAEKKNDEKKVSKKQKTNTNTTSTAAEADTPLMDEAEACLMIEEFGRCFVEDTKVNVRLTPDMPEFAEDLAQRGLISIHSREIVDLCTASEQWRGHSVFWRMLLLFVDRLSLEVATSSRLEDKKTVFLRDRKTSGKPLYECTKDHIYRNIAKCQGAERMEMQCSLNVLKDRGTADVLGVLRWLLYHINIRCVGIRCDLREADMSSVVFERQVEALTKERRGARVRIDSLTLYFNFAQCRDAAVVVKECPWVTVLKIHFIDDVLCQGGDGIRVLETLLLHFPALEQLCVFGLPIGIVHIRTIAAMLPQLVLLEVEFLTLDKLALDLEEEEESMPVLPGLKTLKLSNMYNYSCADIEKFVELFPNLEDVQIPSICVTPPLIDTLSNLPLLRSLEILNGFLPIETAEHLLETLPALECLSVGVKYLDSKLAHALSKCTAMHTLKLRGRYIPGFLASLLQPSPLMTTLKVLCVCRNSGFYRKGSLSAEDLSSKDTAMEKFGLVFEIIY